MSTFNLYSEYYDLLYNDKNYRDEANYIHSLIERFKPNSKSIIDFGCGTGNHDFLLLEKGYEIKGVDLSNSMVSKALAKIEQNPTSNISFCQGDFRSYRENKHYDIVTALFHVMSYQTNNMELEMSILTAKSFLKPGGVFIFDFWYGPAVLNDQPKVKVKRMGNEKMDVLRITEPVLKPNENLVDVNFDVSIKLRDDSVYSHNVKETHTMQYLFLPHLSLLLENCGFEILGSYKWLEYSLPDLDSWYVVMVCKA